MSASQSNNQLASLPAKHSSFPSVGCKAHLLEVRVRMQGEEINKVSWLSIFLACSGGVFRLRGGGGAVERAGVTYKEKPEPAVEVSPACEASVSCAVKAQSLAGCSTMSSGPLSRRFSVRHREVLIRLHLTAPARKAGRGLGTRSAAATLDSCRALLADQLSYGDRWGNPPAGA
ncbi:unnamed protein product [Pleuronectes platessa]|uniref:Uncharacterized protein n=1 Tax=Pleuronectes platessa TaxID=8262 RepID=A0A9N7Z0X6_PLEPL|nr:unnamed protein product [Pleuronectes platessa]